MAPSARPRRALWRTYHSIQLSVIRRMKNGLQFSFADTIGLSDKASADARIEHRPDGTFGVRAPTRRRPMSCSATRIRRAHFMKASFVWLLPKMHGDDGVHARGRAHRERLESVRCLERPDRHERTPRACSYQSGGGNLALTGSPTYAARVILQPGVDLGGGCSSDPLRQFNTAAFQGPLPTQ